MNAETFCEHFATFTDAPNGVDKLRAMILQLAVHGKLVLQDSTEEPSSVIVSILVHEWTLLAQKMKVRSRDAMVGVGEDQFPHDVPLSWQWTKLGCLGVTQTGSTPPTQDATNFGNYISFVKPGDISPSGINYSNEGLSETGVKNGRLFPAGSVLMVCIGGSMGKAAIVDRDVSCNQQINGLTPVDAMNGAFLLIAMRSTYFQQLVQSLAGQGTLPILSKSKWEQIPIPVPPLAEQRRIVEKVDQLLGLCDELAARQAAQREKRQRLVGATLDRLVSTRPPAEFPTHAHRLHNHFDQLFDTPTTIPQLRQTILQLAVQGQLVPQDPNDEPADVLSDRIVLQKNADLSRKNKTGETSSLETESNPPLAQPGSWIWSTLEDVHTAAHTGIDRGKSQQSPNNRYAYLKMNNITADGRCDLREVTRIDATADEVAKYRLKDGDFLFNTRNSAELVGKTCVFTGASDDTFLFNNNILRVYFGEGIDSGFANLWFCSPPGRALLTERKSSTTNVAAIYQGKLMTMPFPIPPLAEQKRIVTKVTELLSLCDALEAKLTQAESASTQLLSAAVHQLLNGAVANV